MASLQKLMKIQKSCRSVLLPLAILIQLLFCNSARADGPKVSPSTQYHFSPMFPWQSDGWNFKPVSPDDPNKPIVDEEIQSLVLRYQSGGLATVTMTTPVKLQTGVIKHLFPNFGFYMIGWSEQEVAGKHVMGLASGIHYCLAISVQGQTTKLFGMNDAPAYGKFLSDNGITIKSVNDARLIWLAYCDIAIVPWHSQDLMQVSPTEWHLGINDSAGHLCYCDFKLGSGQKVVSAEYIIGPSKK